MGRHKSCKLNGIANMEAVHAYTTTYADRHGRCLLPAFDCKLFMSRRMDRKGLPQYSWIRTNRLQIFHRKKPQQKYDNGSRSNCEMKLQGNFIILSHCLGMTTRDITTQIYPLRTQIYLFCSSNKS